MVASETLADRFQRNGITRAAIIDDAFDPPNVRDEQKLDFWTCVSEQKDLLAALHAISPAIEDEHGIDEVVVSKLWRDYAEQGVLKDACRETLFRDALPRLQDLKLLDECLREVGISDVQHIGPNSGLPDNTIRLVFLDFSLDGQESTISEADLRDPAKVRLMMPNLKVPELARKMAEQIWTAAGKEKPFVVLISDHREAGLVKDRFLAESLVLGGLFGFMAKSEFVNRRKTLLKLASWGIGDADCQQIQRFVTAAVDSVDAVAKQFKQLVRSYDVHDYSHIQRIALSDEGRPLGSYMLWLFESLLSYEFLNNPTLRAEQQNTDTRIFKKCIPCQDRVTTNLAKAFRCAQTVPVDDVQKHPWETTDLFRPLCAMGDIFAKDPVSPVYVLLNAPCDLLFVPGDSSHRKWNPDLSLILIPGDLLSLDHRTDKEELVTDLFEYQGGAYKIRWNLDRAVMITNAQSPCGLPHENYKRIARFRPLYALSIKARFISEMSRLGTPVMPPLTDVRDVEIFAKQNGAYKKHPDMVRGGCIVFRHHSDAQFLLTTQCAETLQDVFSAFAEEDGRSLEDRIKVLDSTTEYYENKVRGLREKHERLLTDADNTLTWLAPTELPFPLPKKAASRELISGMVRIFNDTDASAFGLSTEPVLINVLRGSVSDEISQ